MFSFASSGAFIFFIQTAAPVVRGSRECGSALGLVTLTLYLV